MHRACVHVCVRRSTHAERMDAKHHICQRDCVEEALMMLCAVPQQLMLMLSSAKAVAHYAAAVYVLSYRNKDRASSIC